MAFVTQLMLLTTMVILIHTSLVIGYPFVESPFTCTGGTIAIVAHPDDDLLFLSPTMCHAIQTPSTCFTTIFTTSGDAGLSTSYALGRESGSEAAYAQMLGTTNQWRSTTVRLAGQDVSLRTLLLFPRVQMVHFRLADGGGHGQGFSTYANASLQRLLENEQNPSLVVHDILHATEWNMISLRQALRELLQLRSPENILTQDFTRAIGDRSDHNDHEITAKLAKSVADELGIQITGFVDYLSANMPANISPTDSTAKKNSFYTYASYDYMVCQTPDGCRTFEGGTYAAWLEREYKVGAA